MSRDTAPGGAFERFWRMREDRRVVAIGLVLGILFLGVAGVAWRRLALIEQAIAPVQESLVPAREALVEVERGLLSTEVAFLDVASEGDPVERVIAVNELLEALRLTEVAWREFRRGGPRFDGERELWSRFDRARRRQEQYAGPVGLQLVDPTDSFDVDALLATPQMRELRKALSEQRAVVKELLDRHYGAEIDRRVARAADLVDAAKIEAAALFALAGGGAVVLLALLWRAARIHEREVAERERLRAAQERYNEIEAKLRRALDMVSDERMVFGKMRETLAAALDPVPVELLLATSERGPLRREFTTDESGELPGCPVDLARNCPALQSGATRVFDSPEEIDSCPYLAQHPGGPWAAACVPLNVTGRAAGVLHAVTSPESPPSAEDVAILEMVSARTGDRITLLRAMAESERQARSDPLTGLLNRRSLEGAVARLRERGVPYVVAYGDLDRFKRLNDTHGHETGDRALRAFTRALRDSVRPDDLVSRYGGEEFVVVLPECRIEDAVRILERVRNRLASETRIAGLPPFTVSFGVAAAEGDELFESVLARADAALLAAKNAGRDRVVVAGDESSADHPARTIIDPAAGSA
ncbi:MAG: hypothetical protein KatS3mg008_1641 [Acidimicrobiales bacterium]|nr:MAG: hypothetical protein KatS3mg008_1641 [Acidimicrobiales bacterium]